MGFVTCGPQLVSDRELVLLVAHHERTSNPGYPVETIDRGLQHRPLADHRQQLLGE